MGKRRTSRGSARRRPASSERRYVISVSPAPGSARRGSARCTRRARARGSRHPAPRIGRVSPDAPASNSSCTTRRLLRSRSSTSSSSHDPLVAAGVTPSPDRAAPPSSSPRLVLRDLAAGPRRARRRARPGSPRPFLSPGSPDVARDHDARIYPVYPTLDGQIDLGADQLRSHGRSRDSRSCARSRTAAGALHRRALIVTFMPPPG